MSSEHNTPANRRRVVVTGIGAVSPFGFGAADFWAGLVAGTPAFGPIRAFDAGGFASQIAAEVPDYTIREFVPKSYRKATKVMARDVELAVIAAKLAAEHAGIVTIASEAGSDAGGVEPTYPSTRLGCSIGAGLIAAEITELSAAMIKAQDESGVFDHALWGAEGMQHLTPLWLLKTLPNMLACHVTIVHGAKGPSNTVTCAEASGLLSIGELARIIERGDADAGFGGSLESKVNPMGLIRMEFAGKLASVAGDADPASVIKPYDPASPGTLLGEGGGLLMLESLETAGARGATVIAEVIGFGAGHAPQSKVPEDRARGLTNAIRAALRDASCDPSEIDGIVPGASGEPAADAEEAAALRAVFGETLSGIPLLTIAPLMGNAIAGQGGLLAASAALALQHQRLPPRLHAGTPPADLRCGPADGASATLRTMLVCTGGLGGQTAALVFRTLS